MKIKVFKVTTSKIIIAIIGLTLAGVGIAYFVFSPDTNSVVYHLKNGNVVDKRLLDAIIIIPYIIIIVGVIIWWKNKDKINSFVEK